jgi:hypothetical protein
MSIIDERPLRAGSANFSGLGETRQDNDLVALRGASVCSGFEAKFDRATFIARGLPPESGTVDAPELSKKARIAERLTVNLSPPNEN